MGSNGGPPTLTSATASAGGSLTAGTYYYKITTVTKTGESIGSTERNATAANGDKITLVGGAVAGSVQFKIYRGTASGAEVLLDTVTAVGGAWTPYVDDGSKTPGVATVPTVENSKLPLGWGNYGATTFPVSYLTDAAIQGNILRMSATGSTNYLSCLITAGSTTVQAGDVVRFVGKVRLDTVPFLIKVNFGGGGNFQPLGNLSAGTGGAWATFQSDYVMPATIANLELLLQLNAGSGNVDIAQLGMYNLTKLGVTP
jgi:hypothetical protein